MGNPVEKLEALGFDGRVDEEAPADWVSPPARGEPVVPFATEPRGFGRTGSSGRKAPWSFSVIAAIYSQ